MTEFPPDEEWLELPVDVRYLVSTHGRMYSTLRGGAILVPQPLAKGGDRYRLFWRIPQAGTRQRRNVACAHTVLTLFGPPRPSDWHVARCLDGDEGNVRLDNLAWRPRHTYAHMRELSHRAHPPRIGFAAPIFLPPSRAQREQNGWSGPV